MGEQVARMARLRNKYILVGERERKRSLGKFRSR
jgi:hypothetical protein